MRFLKQEKLIGMHPGLDVRICRGHQSKQGRFMIELQSSNLIQVLRNSKSKSRVLQNCLNQKR